MFNKSKRDAIHPSIHLILQPLCRKTRSPQQALLQVKISAAFSAYTVTSAVYVKIDKKGEEIEKYKEPVNSKLSARCYRLYL